MANRRPRIGAAGLTKTQALRQARSEVKEYEQKKETARPQQVTEPVSRRRHVVTEQKKVNFTRPTATKATMARVKHAEKFKQEYERKREETVPARRAPRRTAAPISRDVRFGRERAVSRTPTRSPSRSPFRAPRRLTPSPVRRVMELPPIPERTRELAKSMKAQVIQAEPVGEGLIDSIVIPPRVVDENRTTIVSIPQTSVRAAEAVSEVANRSIQVISETLDEQDAAEAATVQGKLGDLQQARRDFVMAVANVGGNAVQLGAEERRRYIQRVPNIEGEMYHVEYGRDNPNVGTHEFAQRNMAGIREREAARRVEEEFTRSARQPLEEDLRFDVPYEEDLQESIPWEETEEFDLSCHPTRITDIPVREESYDYPTFDPSQLGRFFDVERYPPTPPDREHLHPDLCELEDPWTGYDQYSRPDVSDFIRFDSP